MRVAKCALVGLLLAMPAWAGVREVQLALPIKAKLPLSGHEKLAIGPFIREVKGDEGPQKLAFDVPAEFERYIRRLLRKESKFVLVPPLEGVRPPTTDPIELAHAADFWREVGTRTGADFIVAGSIDFKIQDRTGYKTEEYTAADGRTYYRQKLVEQTGFTYDILLQVYDARTGNVVLEEPLKDFQERQERNFDEFTGMFANLYAMENHLIGVFVPRTIKSKRLLFVP